MSLQWTARPGQRWHERVLALAQHVRISREWATRLAFGFAALFAALIFVRHAVEASRVLDGVRYFWLDDDQMISMRYARNLAEGKGLVWNEGEYVEGYSNFLWTLVMALVHVLGAPDPTAALFVKVIAWALILGALWLCLKILIVLEVESRLVMSGALLTIVCCTDVMYWAASGFSTPLATFLHVFVVLRIIGQRRLDLVAALALACLPLVRSDSVVLWGADALLALLLASDRKRTLLLCAATLVPTLAHLGFRVAYYGDWFPNTYYLKVTGRSDRLALGLKYARQFTQRYPILLLMSMGVSLTMLRQRRWFGLALPVVVLPIYAYVLAAGGDNFRPFRFFSPSMPLIIVFAAAGAAWMVKQARVPRMAWLALVFFAVLPTHDPLRNIARVGGNGKPPKHLVSAIWLRKNASPEASVAVVPAGIVPYFSQLRSLDVLGKNDRHIARLAQSEGARIGHGKIDPEYSLGQAPDYVVSCRARRFAQNASKLVKKDPKKVKRDYVLNLLSSKPFQKKYLKNSVPMKYLETRNAVFVHADSVELTRKRSWRNVKLDR
jgi:hypothetical protein